MNQQTPNPLKLEDLTKSFGSLRAVDGLSLQVKSGEVYGLIGPDGAGKTTTMRMTAGLMVPDAGNAMVFGAHAHKRSMLHRVGYMPQQYSLYGDLSVRENLRFFAGMYGVSKKEILKREKRLLEIAMLDKFRSRSAGALSGGMYKKLALACALIHEPNLLLLDEPTNGVDPISRRELWAFLYELVGEGVTVVVSTPYMDEAERCDRVGLLVDGKLAAQGNPGQMRKNFKPAVFEIDATQQMAARDLLNEMEQIDKVYSVGKKLHAVAKTDADFSVKIASHLQSNNIGVKKAQVVEPSFEDIFLHLSSQGKTDAA